MTVREHDYVIGHHVAPCPSSIINGLEGSAASNVISRRQLVSCAEKWLLVLAGVCASDLIPILRLLFDFRLDYKRARTQQSENQHISNEVDFS